MTATCATCSKTFQTFPSKLKRGGGKYCSNLCYSTSRRVHPSVAPFRSHEAKCDGCGVLYIRRTPGMRFCLEECAKRAYEKQHVCFDSHVSHIVRGEINEHRVIIDLLQKGYQVFKPLCTGCGFDYLATRGDAVERIEVRTGRENPRTGYVKTNRRPHHGNYTILAIAFPDRIIYEHVTQEEKCVSIG